MKTIFVLFIITLLISSSLQRQNYKRGRGGNNHHSDNLQDKRGRHRYEHKQHQHQRPHSWNKVVKISDCATFKTFLTYPERDAYYELTNDIYCQGIISEPISHPLREYLLLLRSWRSSSASLHSFPRFMSLVQT